QHKVFVPASAPFSTLKAEGKSDTAHALRGQFRRFGPIGPDKERIVEMLHDSRLALAVIFPWQIIIPAAPARLPRRRITFAHKTEIADRDDALTLRMAVTVGKGVELLQIANRVRGFRLHPGTQTRLERTMLAFERTG